MFVCCCGVVGLARAAAVAIGARCRFLAPYPLESVRGKGQLRSTSLCVPLAGAAEVTCQKNRDIFAFFVCLFLLVVTLEVSFFSFRLFSDLL